MGGGGEVWITGVESRGGSLEWYRERRVRGFRGVMGEVGESVGGCGWMVRCGCRGNDDVVLGLTSCRAIPWYGRGGGCVPFG